MRLRFVRHRVFLYAATALAAAAASFFPTSYSLIMPGQAVDLRSVVNVRGFRAPRSPFYLTDVRFATHVPPLQLLDGLIPGVRLVRTNDVVPSSVTAIEYDGVEREAMGESQEIAAVVAERAAGYPVPRAVSRVLVVYLSPLSRAGSRLKPLDMLLRIGGRTIRSDASVRHALAGVRAGRTVRITLLRHGRAHTENVPTIAFKGHTALGAYLTTIYQRPRVPIPVTFHLPHVAGSSGGLMFALEIYRTLKPRVIPANIAVAGTGTIGLDGSVGPIEGAAQKIIAARRAEASVFLVPVQNYSEVAHTPHIKVIAVHSFGQALRALERQTGGA